MTNEPSTTNTPMPTIAFGPHRLSRLVVGSNTISGGSHLSRFVNQQMRAYFTRSQTLQHLRDCESNGINAFQATQGHLDLYAEHVSQGGGLQFISLGRETPDDPDSLSRLVDAGTIAIAHHGEVTDVMFREGRLHEMHDYMRRVRDAGVMVGVSTHIPEVIDAVESAGWDVDFYMACVYERHRTREQLKALLGHVPLPVREVYLEEDPPRMWEMMRATERPCLAFKILAAGRLCDRQEDVEQAFRQTLCHIKPNDGLIVGMYPAYEDQVRLNADYVRRYGR